MKTLLSTAFAAAFLFSSSLLADEPKPVELSAAQMDQVVAGDDGIGADRTAHQALVPGLAMAGLGMTEVATHEGVATVWRPL